MNMGHSEPPLDVAPTAGEARPKLNAAITRLTDTKRTRPKGPPLEQPEDSPKRPER